MSTGDPTCSTERTVLLTGLRLPPGIVGGKGAALDRLVGSSIPVPVSGVVTTVAYREFVDVPVLRELIGHIRSDAVISTEDIDAVINEIDFSLP